MFYVLSSNALNQTGSNESLFAGLFIIMFVVIIAGLAYLVKYALEFFKTYRSETSKQIGDFTNFFEKLNNSQELITESLQKIHGNTEKLSEKFYTMDNQFTELKSRVESYQFSNTEKLNDIRNQVEENDDKLNILGRDVEHIRRQVENNNVAYIERQKGDGTPWKKRHLDNG